MKMTDGLAQSSTPIVSLFLCSTESPLWPGIPTIALVRGLSSTSSVYCSQATVSKAVVASKNNTKANTTSLGAVSREALMYTQASLSSHLHLINSLKSSSSSASGACSLVWRLSAQKMQHPGQCITY